MNSAVLRVALQVLLVLCLLAGAVLVAKTLGAPRPPAAPAAAPVLAPPVEYLVVEPGVHEPLVRSQGTAVARARWIATAEVAGTVVAVAPLLEPGALLPAGETLVQLDPREYELALVGARARLLEAEAKLAREVAEAEVARAELARFGIANADPLAQREPQLAEARGALAAAKAAADRAELDLARTRWVLPAPGRVDRRAVEVGQYVRPGDVLAELSGSDAVQVRIPLTDDQLAQLGLVWEPPEGNSVPVELSARVAGADRSWPARFLRLEGRLDPSTRLSYAIVQVDDPLGLESRDPQGAPLFEGTFVRATLRGRAIHEAVVLPVSALRGAADVLILDGENRARFRTVQVFARGRDSVVVTGGLRAAERVVTTALDVAVEGMLLRPVPGPMAPERTP